MTQKKRKRTRSFFYLSWYNKDRVGQTHNQSCGKTKYDTSTVIVNPLLLLQKKNDKQVSNVAINNFFFFMFIE